VTTNLQQGFFLYDLSENNAYSVIFPVIIIDRLSSIYIRPHFYFVSFCTCLQPCMCLECSLLFIHIIYTRCRRSHNYLFPFIINRYNRCVNLPYGATLQVTSVEQVRIVRCIHRLGLRQLQVAGEFVNNLVTDVVICASGCRFSKASCHFCVRFFPVRFFTLLCPRFGGDCFSSCGTLASSHHPNPSSPALASCQ